jgi:branched-chain amino acid transport system permease protein
MSGEVAAITMAARPKVAAAAVKDAAITALVAFGLFFMLVGLRTDVAPNGGLVLRPRWGEVAILVVLAFAGRLGMLTWRGLRGEAKPASAART